ncbi:MAG TPA: DUF4197 domain-containing protein [Methylotenera sp.]|nr:DUF4197 domain-containing protein [Methylotenera sp.]
MKTASLSLLILLLIAPAAQADWAKMFEDFKNAGKSMLGQEINTAGLDNNTMINGLREALEIGSRRAISTVSQQGGYLNNPEIRIPLPPRLQQASDLMKQFGMGQMAEDFETSINRAAENAAPQASELMINAIKAMTIEDARNILQGENDAATRYFEDKTRPQLATLFSPVVDDSLNQVGATRYYNQLDEQMQAVPMLGQNLNMDLTGYVTDQALNGLFVMLAAEEMKIREDPAARSTELLKKVFAQ